MPSDELPISKLESSLVPADKVLSSVKRDKLESEALSKGFDLPTDMFGESRRHGDSFSPSVASLHTGET